MSRVLYAQPPRSTAVIPPDIYRARIAAVAVEDQLPDQYHPEPYEQFVVTFDLLDLPGQTIRGWLTVPTFFGDLANATKLLKAANLPIPSGQYDPGEWIGAELRLNVVERTRADGSKTNKVESYLPAARREPAAAPPQYSAVPF